MDSLTIACTSLNRGTEMLKSAPQFERLPWQRFSWSRRSLTTRLSSRLLPLMLLAIPVCGQVHFDVKSDRVAIQINGKPFSVLHFGKQEHKPFLHPLLTPSGKNILRGFPVSPLPGDSTDRPHQRGVWMGTEGLTGPSGTEDFWENDPFYPPAHKGAIVFQELTGTADGNNRGVLSFVSNWISNEGQLSLIH